MATWAKVTEGKPLVTMLTQKDLLIRWTLNWRFVFKFTRVIVVLVDFGSALQDLYDGKVPTPVGFIADGEQPASLYKAGGAVTGLGGVNDFGPAGARAEQAKRVGPVLGLT